MHGREGRNLPRTRQTGGRGTINAMGGNCVVNMWRVITAPAGRAKGLTSSTYTGPLPFYGQPSRAKPAVSAIATTQPGEVRNTRRCVIIVGAASTAARVWPRARDGVRKTCHPIPSSALTLTSQGTPYLTHPTMRQT